MQFKGSPEIENFSLYLECESPRGQTIVIAAYFDEKLGELLKTQRGNFESRIDRAFAAGLLTENERLDLHDIRKLRNQFAHNLAVNDFDASRSQIVDGLKTWQVAVQYVPAYENTFKTAAERLMYVSAMISVRLPTRSQRVVPPLPEPEFRDTSAWPPVVSY